MSTGTITGELAQDFPVPKPEVDTAVKAWVTKYVARSRLHHRDSAVPLGPMPTSFNATRQDGRRYRIPAGYSLKNWDPSRTPMLMLGSVFDPISLGRWLFDWCVHYFGRSAPLTNTATDLWLLLLHIEIGISAASKTSPIVRKRENRELVEDFLESAERLITKFQDITKACESLMLKVSRDSEGTVPDRAVRPFLLTLFDASAAGELDRVKKWMSSARLWEMRFHANCDRILKNPGTDAVL